MLSITERVVIDEKEDERYTNRARVSNTISEAHLSCSRVSK